jgi:hypothetical protein
MEKGLNMGGANRPICLINSMKGQNIHVEMAKSQAASVHFDP